MSKVIFKSMYLKAAEGGIKHALNLVDYVARREGVITSESLHLEGDATVNQQQLINEIGTIIELEEKALFKQYALFPTKENASRLITDGLKKINAGEECITDPKILLDYIGERPGVLNSKCEEIQHGLFDINGDVESITKTKREMMQSGSNIHHHIISIKLEDAFDIGMDNKQAWESLVRRTAVKLAKQSNISFDDLGLAGAVHQNKTSFHVHLMQYSKSNDRNMYFTDKGLEQLRKSITKDVYQNQILDIAKRRDDFFKMKITPEMVKTIDKELINELQVSLSNHKGRMFYGYLNNDTKIVVGQAVDKLFMNNDELANKLDKYLEQQVKYQSLFNQIDDREKLKEQLYKQLLFPDKNDKTTIHNNLIKVLNRTEDIEKNINKQVSYTDDQILQLEQNLYSELVNESISGNHKGVSSTDIATSLYFNSNIYNLETNELKTQLTYQVNNNRIDSESMQRCESLGYLNITDYHIKHTDKYLLLFANAIKTETNSQQRKNKVRKNKRGRSKRKVRKRNAEIER